MKTNQADYTNTFCYLMNIGSIKNEKYKDKNFINWFKNWEKRILINGSSKENSLELMKKNNPIVIPRNHKVEEALAAANNDNLKPMNDLLSILNKPYSAQSNIESFQSPSNDQNYQTFCGT
jgi:uncharacterized protein YdiU (UPF0061 family)